jgi:hypothetical protein
LVAYNQAEQVLEDHRQSASDFRQRLDARRRGRRATADPSEFTQHLEEFQDLEKTVLARAKEVEQARRAFEDAAALRDQLWGQVEAQWTRAFRANLARAEYAYAAKRERALANALSMQSLLGAASGDEAGGRDDEDLNRERAALLAERTALAAEAEVKFGCTLVAEFLYWPHRYKPSAALVIALVGEPKALNIEVKALQVYEVEQSRGIAFVEPVPEADESDDDPRLTAFFARP